MSDDIKKTGSDAEEKSEAVKKTAVSKKKTKVESTDDSANDTNKKNIIEKLQAMGVMSGKKKDAAGSNDSEAKGFLKVTIAVVVAIGVVGSFVWALNKEAAEDGLTLSTHDHTVQSSYPGSYNPTSNNSYNNRGYNNNNNYNGKQQQREQQKKWMQQQQQAQEQQRAQQQKWAQQWQQAQEQRRAQQQKWAQQPPTQGQYRSQQEKWAQQQRQAQEQQRMQQQKWMEQQQQAQQQQWAQQNQQPRYAYPPNVNHQGQQAAPAYNNAPRTQQPGSYYGRQY